MDFCWILIDLGCIWNGFRHAFEMDFAWIVEGYIHLRGNPLAVRTVARTRLCRDLDIFVFDELFICLIALPMSSF